MTDERGQGFLWGDDDGLEPDNGTGCMPLSMYEKPLYCTLLKDLNGQFYAKLILTQFLTKRFNCKLKQAISQKVHTNYN